ncbi:MAG: 2-hydroxyacid dehydrogenase [Pseudomonadota bacterium]
MNDLPRVPVLGVARLSPLFAALIRERHALLDRLHETDPAAFAVAAPGIRAVAAGGDSRVDAGLIARLPALQIISVMGVGYDGIDVEAARARGVVVTHTPDVLNDEVADLAIGLMLAAARQLPAADRYVRSGQWEARGPMPLARKMSGSRLGLVGMGRIGQAIAHRAQAFGMSIAYTARSAKPGLPYRFVASVEELAAGSDFLVLITPGGAGTRHLVDAKVLRALGPKGILVNVARGSVVDEAALVDALEQGVLGGAALDVFEDEPRVPARLLALPHVVVAPHIGSATHATRQAMADLAFANLQARLAGQPLLTPVPECA